MHTQRNSEAAQRAADLFESGFVLLDLETTSTRSDPDVRIVEIGILDSGGAVLLNVLVDPERDITEVAESIHGIDESEVAHAPAFPQIYSKLVSCLDGQRVATYNTEADSEVLAAVCEHYGRPMVKPREWVDVMDLYSTYIHATQSPKLIEACKEEEIPVEDAHSALGDCRLALALLRKMAQEVQPAR